MRMPLEVRASWRGRSPRLRRAMHLPADERRRATSGLLAGDEPRDARSRCPPRFKRARRRRPCDFSAIHGEVPLEAAPHRGRTDPAVDDVRRSGRTRRPRSCASRSPPRTSSGRVNGTADPGATFAAARRARSATRQSRDQCATASPSRKRDAGLDEEAEASRACPAMPAQRR